MRNRPETKCPNCKTNEKVVRLGETYIGRKRYGCKSCHKSFYDEEGEQRDLELAKEQLKKMERKV